MVFAAISRSKYTALTFRSPPEVTGIQTLKSFSCPINLVSTMPLIPGDTSDFPATRMCISFTSRSLKQCH